MDALASNRPGDRDALDGDDSCDRDIAFLPSAPSRKSSSELNFEFPLLVDLGLRGLCGLFGDFRDIVLSEM
jgi:hypothetical protein